MLESLKNWKKHSKETSESSPKLIDYSKPTQLGQVSEMAFEDEGEDECFPKANRFCGRFSTQTILVLLLISP